MRIYASVISWRGQSELGRATWSFCLSKGGKVTKLINDGLSATTSLHTDEETEVAESSTQGYRARRQRGQRLHLQISATPLPYAWRWPCAATKCLSPSPGEALGEDWEVDGMLWSWASQFIWDSFPHMQSGEDHILPPRAADRSKKKRKAFINGNI